MSGSWQDFYYGSWQWPWALLVGPFAFAAWRAVAPAPGPGALPSARGFVLGWSALFTVETMLDPLATGPLARALADGRLATVLDGGAVATALGLLFVLLGDFRIWWVVFGLDGARRGLLRAGLATIAVPAFAGLVTRGLGLAFGALPDQLLWLVHESAFFALAAVLARRQASDFGRAVLAWAATYYALWSACDVLILAGVDAGWLLRCVPNQLYYGFTVPYVFGRFFAPRYASTSTSTQASR